MGVSIETFLDALNEVLRGWHGYFQHSHWTTFPTLDSNVRGRLRAILRNRHGRRGRGRGSDHQRWPHYCFAKLDLFSLTQARAEALFSLRYGATH